MIREGKSITPYPKDLIKRRVYTRAGFVLLVFLSAVSLLWLPDKRDTNLLADNVVFKDGDVIFIRTRTWRSLLVRFLENPRGFSHVGIIRIVGETPFVVHATPNAKTVQAERAEDFLSHRKADMAGVYRLKDESKGAGTGEVASKKAWAYFKDNTPFDHTFDILKHDALYCTQLVWAAYKYAGVDFGEDEPDFLYDSVFYGKVLLPERLKRSKQLAEVKMTAP